MFFSTAGSEELALPSSSWATRSPLSVPTSRLAELFYDRGNSYEFTSLVRELEGPGSVNDVKEFPFAFEAVDKKFESYSGINVRLR